MLSFSTMELAGRRCGRRRGAGPFGFGLSDTSAFVDAPIDGAFTPEAIESEVVAVSVTVTNSSSAAGSETVQVDHVPPAEGVVTRRSLKALVSFEQAAPAARLAEVRAADVCVRRFRLLDRGQGIAY
ncbi:uncharacterized protein SPSK_01294 [Sporothrix schenckii 1099-18]|uniref:Fibronectin type III-like domain-containing protein n=1 Tax=Sporothrix schenckii 1099-18 TaxID=1397361 RepID=A0A0F2LV86_SPOSC|nr:uncharacterized protein SPSK_01294 [Sporothrix schenckii 1099-18]KJR81377.1 hypothetical protein SPSK_01294 [Sporothrix schenckii 1099-18]